MTPTSSREQYGAVAIAIHWATALLIVGLLVSGLLAANLTDAPPALVAAHIAMGFLVLSLTLLRITWWRFFDRRPDDAAGPRWQGIAARSVHMFLYAVILLMAASGIALVLLSGTIPALMAGSPLPAFADFPPHTPHWFGARLLLVLLAAHIGAALYHQFVRGDRLMSRMGVGRPSWSAS